MTYRVALLPGDGVGPEVIAEARKAMILAIRQRLDLARHRRARDRQSVWRDLERVADARSPRRREAAQRLIGALEETCLVGRRTRDVGGDASTTEVGDAVAELVARG